MRKNLSIIVLIASLTLILIACGAKDTDQQDVDQINDNSNQTEGNTEIEDSQIIITDLQGNTIELANIPERIVSLTAGDLNTLYDLGVEVVGRPVIRSEMPEEIAKIPEVGTSNDVDIEKIASMQPDVVIAHPQLNKEVIPALTELGISVIETGANSIDEVKQSIEMLGQLVQKEEKSAQIIKEIDTKIEASSKNETDELRTLVVFGAAGNWMAALPTSLSGNILDAAGGYNIAEDYEKLERFPQYAQLDMEKIIEADPEVIFFITPGPFEEAVKAFTSEMEQNPAWESINAVRENNFISLPNELFGANPGSRIIDSLDYLNNELAVIQENK